MRALASCLYDLGTDVLQGALAALFDADVAAALSRWETV